MTFYLTFIPQGKLTEPAQVSDLALALTDTCARRTSVPALKSDSCHERHTHIKVSVFNGCNYKTT